jgi:hypothetical protein
MNERRFLQPPARRALRLLFSIVLLLGVSPRVAAQTFAVGGGGMILNDNGTGTDLTGFRTYGGFIFVEMLIEEGVGFQLRAAQFDLPGTQPNTPKLKTNAETAMVSYAFAERWWRAGLFAGLGAYHLSPKDLQPGQASVDSRETVLGLTGGAFTAFSLVRHVDARVEIQWAYIKSVVIHRPVSLTAGVAYKF